MENEVLLTIEWRKADIVKALEDANITPSNENIEKLLASDYRLLKRIEETGIEAGWDIIDTTIRQME